MGFPADWNGSKILIKIIGGFDDKDLTNFPLHIRDFDHHLLNQNLLINGAKDIRFTRDQAGLELLDFKILNTSKIDIIINVGFVSSVVGADIYLWYGNQYAEFLKYSVSISNPYQNGRLRLSFKKIY